MLPAGFRPLRPVVVGDDTLEETLSGWESDAGRELDAEAVDAGAIREGNAVEGRPDCVVVDGEELGTDCVDVVAACSEVRPELPVVLLVDGTPEVAAAALDAGATETLPRAVVESEPRVAAEQIREAIERERARQGFGEVFENVSDGLVVHDPETGEIRDVNERYCEITGYDREELVGDNLRVIVSDESEDSFEDALERIERARTEGPQLFEFEGLRKDGTAFVGEVHLSVVDLQGREQVLASVRDVTERKRRESEYEQIFNSVNDGITIHDTDTGEILDANETYLDIFGYDDIETVRELGIEGLSATEEGYTEERARALISDIASSEESKTVEWRIETADGEKRWFESTVAPAEIGGEKRVLAIQRDVTKRKRREREYEQIFNSVTDTIAVIDPDSGEIVDVNESLCDMLGYEKAQLLGMNPAEISVGEEGYTEDRGEEIVDQVVESGERYRTEWQIETSDGSTRWLDIVGTTATIGGETRYLSIGRDVTQRRRLERTYREVFESVSDGLAVQDPETGELLDVNERYCDLMGYDREELVGKTVADLIPEDADYTEREAFGRIERAREEGPQLFEVDARRKDGTAFVGEVHLSAIELRGEERLLASVRDVTERKRRERMVESLHDATERLQEAETTEEACQRTVEAARDVLELPMTACWLHRDDADDPRLEPVAVTEPVEEIDPGPFRPGDIEYEAFQAGELLVYDPSEHFPENPLDAAIMLPLGEHGMLAAGKRGVSEYDEFVVDAARTLAGHVRTALDRVTRAERLRESERRLTAILDRIDEAIFLAPATEINDSDPAADYVSAGYESVYGLSLQEMHDTYEEGFFGLLHPDEYDAYWAFVEGIRRDIEAGDPADSYSREYRIDPPDGEHRWIRSDYYPTRWDDGERKIVVVSRDVTERKEREQTLESFHDATAELTTADTVDEVGQIAVQAAAEVFALPATAVYSYDENAGVLEPAAAGPGVDGELGSLDAGDDPAWAAFVEERMRRVEVAGTPALDRGPTDEALLVPLGGNGLLAVWHAGEELDPDAANIMAATVEAALNRLRGERRLETRSEELQAQAERARRLEAVTELTRRVEAAITAESSRRGVQEAVCEELTDVDPFGAACVAEADVGTDRLTPRAVAGIDRDHAERSLDAGRPGDADTHPAYEAWQTGQPAVVEDLVGGRRSGWRRTLLSRGAGSVCAVPLAYGGVTHGVLTVVADEPGAFGEHEREVFDQLGTSIGYAITAVERQRALESDDTLELAFEGARESVPFGRLADALGCRVRHERTVRRQDGSVSVYYTLSGDLPDGVAAAAEETLPGTVETITRADGEAVIERRGSSWFGAIVSEYGGVLRHGEASPSELSLVVELPREADTRTIVERLREAFPGLELTAQRQHRETAATAREVAAQLERRLTDRQLEALQTAHAMGYFDWPRESSGEDVAEALGITQPTVNKHIRLGERGVFELLFGSDEGS